MGSPRSCCITGHISQGTPTGEFVKIGGVDAYMAKPKGPSTQGVIIATDVFGYKLPNVQLIADTFALEGFYTVVPDMFNGGVLPFWLMDALPKMSGIPGDLQGPPSFFSKLTTGLAAMPLLLWFTFRNPAETKVPILEAVAKNLRTNQGIDKIGMVAYCYGGAPALIIAKKPDVIDTFVVAHAQVKVPSDITTNVKPGLIIAAEVDYAFPRKARKQAQEIIEKDNLADQIRIRYFPGTFHGFAVRGDDQVDVIRKAKEEAFRVAVEWLKEHVA